MKLTKKMFVMCLLLGVIVFAGQLWSTEVLYAPFEVYTNSTPAPTTKVFVNIQGTLQPKACPFTGGVPPIPGKVGKCFEFNGSRYITVQPTPSIGVGTKDFAITFWVNTRSRNTNNTIIDKRLTHKKPGYHVTLYNGKPLVHICDNVYGWLNYIAPTAVNDGMWHHVAIYVDRDDTNGGKIYIDGICSLTFNPTKHVGSLENKEPLYIGKHVDTPAYNFVGLLDEVEIFSQL